MHMNHRRTTTSFIACALACAAVLAPGEATRAGNHVESTWLPVEQFNLRPDTYELKLRRPYDRFGVVRQPMVFLAMSADAATATQPADRPRIEFTCNGRDLPAWDIQPHLTAYVIGIDTLEANDGRAAGQLWITARVSAPRPFALSTLGSPDFLAAPSDFDGPLELLIERLPAGDARTGFEGLSHLIGNRLDAAEAACLSAQHASDERIGRFARRNLRMIRYMKRPQPYALDYATRRNTLMYLQQIGLFALARVEGSNIGPFDGGAADAWHRLSELVERLNSPPETAAKYAWRAGLAAAQARGGAPVEWYVLVVILNEEEVERQRDGRTVRETVRLTTEQVERIYHDWFLVQQFVFGASDGMLLLKTDFVWLKDQSVQKYTTHAGMLYGPADDLFAVRGAYDSVISIRPTGGSAACGPDVGPNGAALTDLGPDRGWEVMLHEWNHQFDWTTIAAESAPGYPVTHDSDGCGIRPIPSMGFGHRSSMRYYMTLANYRKTMIAAPAVPEAYLRRWMVEGPYEVSGTLSPDGMPDKHVLDPFPPAGASPVAPRPVESATPFVDLRHHVGDVRWGVAKASCWVYSPREQVAAMWLGHNDGMAVWVNRQLVHRGVYYATARWEDKNLPDMVMSRARLRRGWNRIEAIVEGWPAPREKGWGFSLRLTSWENREIPGLAFRVTDPAEEERAPEYEPPAAGRYYDWAEASGNYHDSAPRLSDADLQAITGVAGLVARGAIDPADPTRGHVALGVPEAAAGPGYRVLPETWDRQRDTDWTLNNVMDWSREDTAAYAYRKDDRWRALLVLRPEAYRAYLELLNEAPEAKEMFGELRPSQRVLGYLYIPPGSSARTLLVVDAALGDPAGWPVDEEDLLKLPISEGMEILMPPAERPARTETQSGIRE